MNQGKYTYKIIAINSDRTMEITVNKSDEYSAKNEVLRLTNIINANMGYIWNSSQPELVAFESVDTTINYGSSDNNSIDSLKWQLDSRLSEIKDLLKAIKSQGEGRL